LVVLLLIAAIPWSVVNDLVAKLNARRHAMHSSRSRNLKFDALGATDVQYAVVIDCGSSGSRLHAYTFSRSHSGIDVVDELFVRLKPGLGKYAGRPAEGAASLKPLIDAANGYVPAAAHAMTPIIVGATAGLRVLAPEDADALLNAVGKLVAETKFRADLNKAVFIMSGSTEGAFAWLAVNFLIKRIGSQAVSEKKPVSVLDLGGGSVQIVRALGTGREQVGSTGQIVSTGGGREDRVFVHSFLGLGLLASRMAVLKSSTASYCIPIGADSYFSFNGQRTHYGGRANMRRHPDVKKCAEIVKMKFSEHHYGCDDAASAMPGGDVAEDESW
jgi:hypothetical protein